MQKALFLDRDGVINVDKSYIYKTEDIEFAAGIFQFLKTAADLGFELVVITNQAGIARGMYTEEDVVRLHEWMSKVFNEKGINIRKFYFCPHHPDFSEKCNCRKPEIGMVTQAAEELKIDLKKSVIIGDKKSDVKTGKNAGMPLTILIKGEYEDKPTEVEDFFAADLFEAENILKEYYEA